jgi:UDP-2,3-diacylglucosamine pyrophosphatase LpxH
MKRLKLVCSDFHLATGVRFSNGAPNPLEDFRYDHRFKEMLEYYSQPPFDGAELELIFNGDMLNLIQTDYRGHFPVVITEAISCEKLLAIINGHPIFFKSLKDFLSNPHHSLTFVIGNHDQEMMWQGCRALLEKAIGGKINWKNFYYEFDGVHIEHGHQYEAINRIDASQPFLVEGLPEPIINLPWGSLFTIEYIVRLKQHRPYIDKVRPFKMILWWSLINDTWVAISYSFRLIYYFLSTRFTHNRYRKSDWRTTLKMVREASVFPDLSDAARRILRSPDLHTVIFGHTHVYKHVQVAQNKQYLNLGTWTDIVSMDLETFARRSRLVYARIDYNEESTQPQVSLRHWIGRIPQEEDALL